MAKDLVKIIRENPGCIATVDNDCWWIHSSEDPEGEPIVSDDEVEPLGNGGYGSGNSYGGDILQALAIIVGIKVESV